MSNVKNDKYACGMTNWNSTDDEAIGNYTSWQTEIMLPFIGKRVMEVGCGSGRFADQLINQNSVERYVGIEPSPNLFSKVKKNDKVEIYNSTVEELDGTFNHQFDTVILIHVLEHIKDDQEFLLKLDRFLVPGGRLIVMVPAFDFLMSDLDRNIGHYRRYNRKSISKLAKLTNYKIDLIRYNNLVGILGWLWFCKIRKFHYQDTYNKKRLLNVFKYFDKYIAPCLLKLEKIIPPPLGLNITAILQR